MRSDIRYDPIPQSPALPAEEVAQRLDAAKTAVQMGDRTVPATRGVTGLAPTVSKKVLGGKPTHQERPSIQRFGSVSASID